MNCEGHIRRLSPLSGTTLSMRMRSGRSSNFRCGGRRRGRPCGTTGEASTLSYEEHERVIELTVKWVEGKVPVIAGTGSNSTKETIELTEIAKKLGADMALLVAPYYNRPTQAGLYSHFRQVAEEVDIPWSSTTYRPERASTCSPNWWRASPDPEHRGHQGGVGLRAAGGRYLQAYQGPISYTLRGRQHLPPHDGGGGDRRDLGGLEHTAPGVKALADAFLEEGPGKGPRPARRADASLPASSSRTSPAPVKEALYHMGYIEKDVRPPLCGLSKQNSEYSRDCQGLSDCLRARVSRTGL